MRDSCTWVIAGTKTYRLGSRKILSRWGANLQNIEKSMRFIYEADPGKLICQTDQAGAEALIVAYLCEAGAFRQLFIHGVKPHVYVALHLFKDVWKKKLKIEGVDIDKIIATPIQALKSTLGWKELDSLIKDSDNWNMSERYYYLAKQTCHSANYGITGNPFRMNILEKSGGKINVPQEEAERFLLVYHSLFPEIQDWHRRLRRQVEMTRIVYNLLGHPIQITGYNIEENKWKEIFALVPQSTVGMIANVAFKNMYWFCKQNKLSWDTLINGHDSIVSQAPIAEAIDCAKKQKEFIEIEMESPVDSVRFRMRSESMIGANWGPYKEGKNENGLREVKI